MFTCVFWCWYITCISILQVLEHEINTGYTSFTQLFVVIVVNGVEVKTVKELSEVIKSCTKSHIRFDLQVKKVAIIHLSHCQEVNASLLFHYGVIKSSSEGVCWRMTLEMKLRRSHEWHLLWSNEDYLCSFNLFFMIHFFQDFSLNIYN